MKCVVCLVLLETVPNNAITIANGNAVCMDHMVPALVHVQTSELIATVKRNDQRSQRFLKYLRGEDQWS